jgi:hypothetical protein
MWGDMKNRRQFFEQYAVVNKFDPLIPNNWYRQAIYKIMLDKVLLFSLISALPFYLSIYLSPHTLSQDASKVVGHHNNSVSKALLDLFPEIGLQKSKLLSRMEFFLNI